MRGERLRSPRSGPTAATAIDYLHHGDQFNSDSLARTSIYYGLFLVVDFTAAAIAFSMEPGDKWRLLWWLALQRYGYRQLTYLVVVRATLSAIAGPFVGWGKLDRKATVSALGVHHLTLSGIPFVRRDEAVQRR